MALQCLRCQAALEPSFKACPHCGEPVTDFLRRYRTEPLDGKYRILERLGTGGMGEVYKVEHTYLGATRVIKVIRPQISDSKDAHERFLREARLATKVQHPNVATLHDFSALPDGAHYMVWEFIGGENLAERLRRRGTLTPREAVRIAIEALEGLEAIHRAGIVHRDISPENLMLTRDETGPEHVKIIDLGVAKTDDREGAGTQTGIFVGKIRYASPEHLGFLGENERIDGRADLYSLAIVLYEMLTGRPPFDATTPHQLIMLHSRDAALRPIDLPPDLPGGAKLQEAVKRTLDRDRNRRFASAHDFADALRDIERELPDTSSMKTMAVAFDPEATMRVTPAPVAPAAGNETLLHRVTERSVSITPTQSHHAAGVAAGASPAERTYGQTLRRPAGDAPAAPPAAQPTVVEPPHSPKRILAIAAVVLLAALGVLTFALIQPKNSEPQPTLAASVSPATPASGTMTVVTPSITYTNPASDSSATTSTTVTAAPAVITATTAPHAPAQPKPAPPHAAPAEHHEAPAPAPVPEPVAREEPVASNAQTFTEGGDSDGNETAINELHRVAGSAKVIGVSGEMTSELLNALRKRMPNVTFTEGGGDVTIHFQGSVERRGMGRKRRSAHATIAKNGRVIFRYELAPEDYRVGDDPAEAFARAISDAFR